MSGSGSGNLPLNMTNMTDMANMSNFSCRDVLSSENLTDPDFWKIGDNLVVGATITGVLVLLFFLVASIWNLFIIITFFVKHQLLKEPANIFLLNVSIVDLLICCTIMVFVFVTAFAQEFVFGMNDVTRCAICDMSGFFLVFLIFVSLHLLMAMSIDRFILLNRPLRYKKIMNRWKGLIILIVMYVISFVLAILPVFGFGEIEFNSRFAACVPRFTPVGNLYYLVVLAVEALIPILTLAVTNVWTFRLVSKFLKRNFRRRSTFRRRDREEEATEENQKHQRQQKQLVKVFGALIIAYVVAYTPTILAIFLSLVAVDIIPSEVFILGFVSFLTNPVIHPIIESFFVKELRYQVSRASKGVRRVSTTIYRQTTQLFSSKTLDEAARRADDENTPTSKRSIRFLNGRMVDVDGGKKQNHSVVTETEDMASSSRSQTPEPLQPYQVEAGLGLEGGMVSAAAATAAMGGRGGERPMLGKTKRSVTFDNHNHLLSNMRPVSTPVGSLAGSPVTSRQLESCLKKAGSPSIVVEGEEEREEGGNGNGGERRNGKRVRAVSSPAVSATQLKVVVQEAGEELDEADGRNESKEDSPERPVFTDARTSITNTPSTSSHEATPPTTASHAHSTPSSSPRVGSNNGRISTTTANLKGGTPPRSHAPSQPLIVLPMMQFSGEGKVGVVQYTEENGVKRSITTV